MRTRNFGLCVAVVCLAGALVGAASARLDSGSEGGQDRVDFSVIEKIRAEGMERSKAVETFEYLTTNIGPRLTNFPAHKQSIAWTQQMLKSWG